MNKLLVLAITLLAPAVALAAQNPKAAAPPPAPPPAAQAAPQPDAQADANAKLQSAEYKRCLKAVKTKPDDGYEEALAWASLGGGEPARHCAALARIAQKQYADGAKRLEALARESKQDPAIRAEMLAQAAQAWILDGNFDQANADQTNALALQPDQPDLLVDRAITLGEVHHYKDAVADLDKVLQRHPDRLDALLLRASAFRYLDDRAAARGDIDRVLSFDPGNVEALVERGILKRLDNDDAGARADWLTVIRMVPSGPVLEEAQRNLELMDVKGTTP